MLIKIFSSEQFYGLGICIYININLQGCLPLACFYINKNLIKKSFQPEPFIKNCIFKVNERHQFVYKFQFFRIVEMRVKIENYSIKFRLPTTV